MELCLVPADTEQQLEQIKTLYMEAFPEDERKPFPLIMEKRKEGSMEILSLENKITDGINSGITASPALHHVLGEAILVYDKDIVLLDYFAISPALRGSGLGSRALELLQQRCGGRRFLLEIENTSGQVPGWEQRMSRKNFYLRGGMKCMDYTVSLFGVSMEIMTYGCEVTYEEYFALYEHVFGCYMKGRVKLEEYNGTAFPF